MPQDSPHGSAPHILVVDDDTRLRNLLRKYLSENSFLVSAAQDAAEARAMLNGMTFDLLVLDVMMPGESGLELAASLRRDGAIPILMLTAMGETDDRIAGLEAGADDYLIKPFEPRELLLRIRTILRRVHAPAPEPVAARPDRLVLGEIHFDTKRSELWRGCRRIHLTSAEALLLRVLAEQPGRILSREELTERGAIQGGERTVDVQVTRLRRKIEPDPREPRYLQTVRGRGYVLQPD